MFLPLLLLLLLLAALPAADACPQTPSRFKTRMAMGRPITLIDPKFLTIPAAALPTKSELRDEFVFPPAFDLSREYPKCNMRRVIYQGPCGTCWAVSSATVLSDALCIKTATLVEYSAADLLGCCQNCGGYDGGYPFYAFDYFKRQGAVTGGYGTDGCYPYQKNDNYTLTCPYNPACKRGTCPIRTFTVKKVVTGVAERQIMEAIYVNRVPVVVGIYTNNDLYNYRSGILRELPKPSGKLPDHAVKVIGWGTDFSSGDKYWIVVNSWGSDWGMNGTFHLRKGYNDLSLEKGMGAVSLSIASVN